MSILRDIRGVFRNIKHNRPARRLCPRCGSHKLRLSSRFDLWLFPEQYVCEECGYRGPVTLELEKLDDVQSGSSKPS
jgi:predicted RNA-binding Zn-ribbon protein involved in translation (DUF1610 family)